MKKETLLRISFILAPILIFLLYLTPTGYVVSTTGNIISANTILEPTVNTANIYIVTEYVRGRAITLPSISRVDANVFMLSQAIISPKDSITSTTEFTRQGNRYELLAQEQFQAEIIPLVVAFNHAEMPYWLTGSGVIVLADDNTTGLQRGDIIVGANGKQATQLDELVRREYLDGYIALNVLRGNEQFSVRNPDIDKLALSTFNPQIMSNTPLQIRTNRTYVGRSADLSTALYAYQLLTEPLAPDCNIVATGTLQPDGTIGRILQIQSKLHTVQDTDMDIFFIPEENFQQVHGDWDFDIIPVTTFSETISYLDNMQC